MSWWMALALAIIVTGGFTILRRLHLLRVALGFWASFAVGIGVLALAGHQMTARWHLGPITGWNLWWILISSPEVLVFLFFMITDPKTAPAGGRARVIYAVTLGLLASLLIAPTRTEFAAKVALLGALAIVCAVKPFLVYVPRRVVVLAAAAAACAYVPALARHRERRRRGRHCEVAVTRSAAADHDPAVEGRPDEADATGRRPDRTRPLEGRSGTRRRPHQFAPRARRRTGSAVRGRATGGPDVPTEPGRQRLVAAGRADCEAQHRGRGQ